MRLQLGSSSKYWPGFMNIDRYDASADVQSDCVQLPMFSNETADEIYAIHLFEHLHRTREVRQALTEWHRVLKAKGKLVLELPCLDKMARLIVAGEKNLRLTLLGLYGDPRETKQGMEHKWGWSFSEITEELMEVGFRDVNIMEPKFHIPERDMRLEAIKP